MARPFADVLRDLAGGAAYDTLTAELGDLVGQVIATRKPGELSLKLKIAPNGETSVSIKEEIRVKAPELPRGASIFFAGPGGALTRNDPRQTELALRDVNQQKPEPATLKEVS